LPDPAISSLLRDAVNDLLFEWSAMSGFPRTLQRDSSETGEITGRFCFE
jgi:hypothetical protein